MTPQWLKTRKIRTRTEELSLGFILTASSPYRKSRSDQTLQIYHDRVLEAITRNEHDIIVGPEYAYFGERPLTAEQKTTYETELQNATKEKDCLVIPGTMLWSPDNYSMKNTAMGFTRGITLFNYDKRQEGGERMIARRYGLVSSYGIEVGIFLWREYYCGIEVCVDKGTLERKRKFGLDFKFLIACGLHETPYASLRRDGYLIVHDGLDISDIHQYVERKS